MPPFLLPKPYHLPLLGLAGLINYIINPEKYSRAYGTNGQDQNCQKAFEE